MARRKPIVSYLRASNARGGLEVGAQREVIRRFAEANGYRVVEEFVGDVGGRRPDALDRRPRLSAALERAREEGCPVLVAGLGRLSSHTRLISELMAQGVPLVVADAVPFTLRAYRTWTGDERVHHGQRIRSGQAIARARGARFGNPANLRDAAARGHVAQAERADQFAATILPIIEGIRADGVTSSNGIARELTQRGVETARGGRWAAMTVRRIVERGGR